MNIAVGTILVQLVRGCTLVSFFITTVLANQDCLIGIEEATVMNRACCADMSHRNIELGLSTERRE